MSWVGCLNSGEKVERSYRNDSSLCNGRTNRKVKHSSRYLRIEFNQDQLDQNLARFVVFLNISVLPKPAYEVVLAG